MYSTVEDCVKIVIGNKVDKADKRQGLSRCPRGVQGVLGVFRGVYGVFRGSSESVYGCLCGVQGMFGGYIGVFSGYVVVFTGCVDCLCAY
jgi:hypothetical protein